ncbi:MAG TPA: hypothetical protein VFE37_06520 [Chloroflexota bacterium]|nr:hypothetical protein [Chloroflexota bacterium]
MATDVIACTTVWNDESWRWGWVRYIRRVYGFDLETAQRVVFFRWLTESGRLSDW